MSRARRLATAALLVAMSVTIFFALGEVLARAFNLVDRLNGFPRRLYVATDDPHLPYRMRPGVDTVVRGVRVVVNEHGLRGPSVPARSAPGGHRILVLGDSATFGENLPVEEAFPAVLERELEARNGRRFEVLNAGVQGYNTEAELEFLRRHGGALAPATVVVGFNLNDFDYVPVMGPLGVLTWDHRLRVAARSFTNRSEFYLLLRWVVSRGRLWIGDPAAPTFAPPAPGQRFSDFDLYVSALRKRYYRRPSDGRWQVMVDALGALGEEARARGIRLVIAILPDGDQLGVAEPDLLPQQKLLAVCASARLDCLDLHPHFAARGDERLHFDIMHPNAAGHRVIAAALAEHLLAPHVDRQAKRRDAVE